jgi:hypothetical protein
MAFIEYARAQGPAVKETLSNLAQAIGKILQGASEAGPGLLTLVNAFAKLVASLPASFVGHLMQVYAAFKLIKLGGAGIAAVGEAFATLRTRVTAVTTAMAGATGATARLRAGFGALGATAKASLVIGGLALVALGIKALADKARGAPPDVDKLTASLKQLAGTGRFTGELKSTFGDVDGLVKKIGELNHKTEQMNSTALGFRIPGLDDLADKVKGAVHDITDGHDSLNALKGDFDSLDKALAGMVSSGYAKEAAKDFDAIKAAALKQGYSLKDVSKLFPEYNSVLADAKFEQQQAAESMGLFGAAAQVTSAKLAEQKQSADGLRGAIQALNDVQRQGLGGMIGFERAIDAAATAAKKNHGALSMTNGVLNLNSEKAQNAASALQDLADKTDSAASSQREAGASWETVNGIYARGRAQLIKNAEAMGLSKEEARALATQILKIPDKTAKVRMDTEDATRDLDNFNAAVRRSPHAKSVTLSTLSKTAEQVLESFGMKVKRLPNGKVKISATAGGALSVIASVAGAIANLRDKHIVLTTEHRTIYTGKGGRGPNAGGAHGGLVATLPRRANGGVVQGFPEGGYIQGPGSPTSDSITAMLPSGPVRVSDSEYVVQASAVRKYGVGLLDMLNAGRLKLAGFARGGKVSKAQQRAREQAKAEAQARHDAMGDLTISHFGWMAGYRSSEFGNAFARPDSVGSLVQALNQWRSIIQKATHGSTENRLLKQLDSTGRSLLKWEKQLAGVTKHLESAKAKLASLKDAAAQLASSVKGNLLSSANITRGAGGDQPVTLASIRSGMTVSRDKVVAFASALKQLKAKGFSKSIIQQVAEAGIDGGGLETAGALLQASASEVKTINATQAQIESAAGSAGKTTADTVYAKAIKDQTKVVDRLTKQEHSLQKSMDKLTKAMEKAIERAFGKKAAGGIVGAAASGGLRSSLTWVGEQGPELLDLPAGSRVWSNPDSRRKLAAAQAPWASMLTAPRRAPAAAVAGMAPAAGDGQPLVIQVRIGDKDFGELWVDTGRKAVRARGSIEATLRPPRGR